MNTEAVKANTIKGAEWLLKESQPFETFIPEDFTEEQLMIKDMCSQFLHTEILPNIERIDNMEPGLMRSLLEKAGEQGLLAISMSNVASYPSPSNPNTGLIRNAPWISSTKILSVSVSFSMQTSQCKPTYSLSRCIRDPWFYLCTS